MSAPAGVPARGRRAERAAALRPLLPVLGVIVLLAINLRTIIASLPPLLEEVRADLGLSATVAGLLTTLPVVCFGALAPVAPRLAERVSLERVLTGCAVITTVAAALRGAGGAPALFAGSLLAGAATAVAQSALPVLIRIRHPERSGVLTGAFSMALTLGATLAAAVVVPIEHALGGSWHAALAVWAIPAGLAALAWLPAALRPGTHIHGDRPAPLWRDPLAWRVAGFFGIQSTAFYAALAWLPTILESHGRSPGQAGALQALGALVSAAPAFLVPFLAARRRAQTPILALIVGLAATGVAGLWLVPGAAVVWVVLFGLGQGGALGLGLILPQLRAGDARAAAALTGMTLCFGYLIASAGPWLLGAAHDATGNWEAPLAVLLAITLAELVPGVRAAREGRVGSEGAS
jgi:CP family cyanate transporter-like MFS transporter